MNLFRKITTTLVVLLLALGLIGILQFWHFANTPMLKSDQQPTTYLLLQGSSAKNIAKQLQQQQLIHHPTLFVTLAKYFVNERKLKVGEYQIDALTTPLGLLLKMQKGDAIKHVFTLVEGWTFAQVLDALANNHYLRHTLTGLSNAQVMRRIGHEGEIPEGRFATDTYLFSGNFSDVDVLVRAYQLMQQHLESSWNSRASNLPYHCPYDALIVASLIEKETAVLAEKPIIAGVILRRLQQDMLLQIDAAVIYGLGANYQTKLSENDLHKNTPFNTYLHKGLPPSPIAMPSITSIAAALHPADGTFLYYVAKGDGTHEFSNTLQEQDRAIRKYILHR